MIDFRKIVGYYDKRYPALDATTSHYEFNSYMECCESLNVIASISKFIAYNNYYKKYGNQSKSSQSN